MPYTKTTWTNGSTALSSANMNNLETQFQEASNSFEQDIVAPFVFSGLVATKDGTTATQLDVTAGVAFLIQTDSTLRRRAPTSSTQSTSGHPSTVLYLDLNPDGTWSFGTSHSGVTNYLPIAQVTTDGSSNISTVTDERNLTLNFFNGMAGSTYQVNGVNLVTAAGGSLTLSSLTVIGATTFDAAPLVSVTLGGSDQKVLEFKATDGDDCALYIRSTNVIGIFNITTSTWIAQWTAAGTSISPVVEASSVGSFGGGNYSLIATASNGAIYSDNGNLKSTGSGTLNATAFDPAAGNGTFSCRGNSSGTGSGTFSHGAGTTPNIVLPVDSQASASMTVGTTSYTSTQFTLTTGASHTWKAIAL